MGFLGPSTVVTSSNTARVAGLTSMGTDHASSGPAGLHLSVFRRQYRPQPVLLSRHVEDLDAGEAAVLVPTAQPSTSTCRARRSACSWTPRATPFCLCVD